MLLADALAARFLAQKVAESALRLGSTDNVTCVVGLLRWPGTPRTVAQWGQAADSDQGASHSDTDAESTQTVRSD